MTAGCRLCPESIFSLFPLNHQEVSYSLEAHETPQVVMTYRHLQMQIGIRTAALLSSRTQEDRLLLCRSWKESNAVWAKLNGGLGSL